jgi:hypothetical protein
MVTVEKDGHQDEMPETVWEAIGMTKNKYGWTLVSSEPPEVTILAQKKTVSMEMVTGVEPVIKELKPKGRPKA